MLHDVPRQPPRLRAYLLKPRIVLSGVNLVEGGTLSIFREALAALSANYLDRYDVTALVHRQELFDAHGISYREFPEVKSSWIRRLQFEYMHCRRLSRELQPVLWLAMHDMTPNVSAHIRAVYCHNPSPFYRLPLREAPLSPTFTLFRFFYGYLYSINIRQNSFVVVQQDWLRNEFMRRYDVQNVVVAHPSVMPMPVAQAAAPTLRDERFTFLYPALPRPFKNMELLLEAAQLLEQQGIGAFALVLTIDGSENRYSAKLRRDFGNVKSVRWLGRQSREQVETLYSEADCLLFPSKLETWGMPITEWKRTQKPMLIANLPYCRETVGDYSNVAFVDTGDARELAHRMQSVLQGNTALGSSSAPIIASPFARDWPELFDILLAGVSTNGSLPSETAWERKPTSKERL